ncbi:MAG: hypothetical protein WC989_04505 [Micavibrio sp.]
MTRKNMKIAALFGGAAAIAVTLTACPADEEPPPARPLSPRAYHISHDVAFRTAPLAEEKLRQGWLAAGSCVRPFADSRTHPDYIEIRVQTGVPHTGWVLKRYLNEIPQGGAEYAPHGCMARLKTHPGADLQ